MSKELKSWLEQGFATLAFMLPAVWLLWRDDAVWPVRAVFWLFVLIALLDLRPIARDRVVQGCVLLAVIVVAGYLWQRMTIPEALLGGSSAKKYILSFCFFVVLAYGASAAPRASPFLLLVSAAVGLLAYLAVLPADTWVAGWRGGRLDFGFRNAQHASVFFGAALLAGLSFFPRALFSCPRRARAPVFLLLAGFVLLMAFGVVATQTRATWLGLVFSGVALLLSVAAAVFAKRLSLRRLSFMRGAVAIAGILLAGTAAYHFWAGGIIAHRLDAETISIGSITETAQLKTVPRGSIDTRIGTWSAARAWIAERPVFGWGGRSAKKLIRQSPHFDDQFKRHFGHLHNSYLETLINVGGATLACMIAIIALVAGRVVAAWRKGQMPTDAFLFVCAFYPFWATVNLFESYIVYDSGAFLNTLAGGFAYAWCLRGQKAPGDAEEANRPANGDSPPPGGEE